VPPKEKISEHFKQIKHALNTEESELQKTVIFKLVNRVVVFPKRILIVKLEGE